ncbi:MAG: hypothetical protein OEX97_14120, partial [Acidimicrobiia bacterium]|nr:hypothetical protein [Acidimicrobiia bacterium]
MHFGQIRERYRAIVRDLSEESDVFQEGIAVVRLTVMRIGSIASAATALALLITGSVVGNTDQLLESITPALVAIIFGWQALTDGRRALAAILAALFSVVVTYDLVGTEATQLPAALAMVIIGGMGLLFVASRRIPYLVGVSCLIIAAGGLWM